MLFELAAMKIAICTEAMLLTAYVFSLILKFMLVVWLVLLLHIMYAEMFYQINNWKGYCTLLQKTLDNNYDVQVCRMDFIRVHIYVYSPLR